jgi:hypothetical protein
MYIAQPTCLQELSNLATSIPRISSSKPITPYISATTHSAYVDRSHLVTARDRELSSGVRTVQDPIEIKARAAQVRLLPVSQLEAIFYEENLSQINMTQNLAPSWVPPCNNDDLSIIVTLRRLEVFHFCRTSSEGC